MRKTGLFTHVRANLRGDVSGKRFSTHAIVMGSESGVRCGIAQGHGTSLPGTAWTWHCDTWGEHGDNCEAQCGPAVRKKPRFTHVGDNLRGDVSRKRFSAHVGEGKVERIGDGRCGNDKWMSSAWGE